MTITWFKKERKPLKDSELIDCYRNSHDPKYVGELYQRYLHLVTYICSNYLEVDEDIEDASMDIFEKLLDELKRHEIRDFKNWLHSVTRNHCLKILRKKNPVILSEKVTKLNGSAFLGLRQEFGVGIKEDKHQIIRQMMQGLQWLNNEQRECLEHFYLDDMSYKQVADYTGYSVNQVKSHIQNGKRNLKIYLSNQENEGGTPSAV